MKGHYTSVADDPTTKLAAKNSAMTGVHYDQRGTEAVGHSLSPPMWWLPRKLMPKCIAL